MSGATMFVAAANSEAWWSNLLLVLIFFGICLFAAAVYALYWAAKNGQFRNFEKGARVIFDEEEPEGEQLDFFPDQEKVSDSKIEPKDAGSKN